MMYWPHTQPSKSPENMLIHLHPPFRQERKKRKKKNKTHLITSPLTHIPDLYSYASDHCGDYGWRDAHSPSQSYSTPS